MGLHETETETELMVETGFPETPQETKKTDKIMLRIVATRRKTTEISNKDVLFCCDKGSRIVLASETGALTDG